MEKPATIFLVIMAAIFVSACITPNQDATGPDPQTAEFNEIVYMFVGKYTPLTELQKEQDWVQYIGRLVEATGVVKELPGDLIILIEHPKNKYENGASIYFKESEREKLAGLKVGNSIRFAGALDFYSNSKGLIVRNATVSQP